jgi:hypothetical protein
MASLVRRLWRLIGEELRSAMRPGVYACQVPLTACAAGLQAVALVLEWSLANNAP